MFYLCPNEILSKIPSNKYNGGKRRHKCNFTEGKFRAKRSNYTVFFNFNNWDLEEETGEGIQSNANETLDENGDVLENFERTFHIH